MGLEVENIDEAYASMSSRGVPFEHPPRDQPWGGRDTAFADPDGNTLFLSRKD